MQKALIVRNDDTELNKELAQGWKVINMCGMPSFIYNSYSNIIKPTCLVILEKDENDKTNKNKVGF